jgi:hypothetical protein
MSLPFNFQEDPSPVAVLESVPNRTALKRVFQEIDGLSIPDPNLDFEDFVADHNPVEIRQLVSEIQFAHQNQIYYYRVPGLGQVSFEEPNREPKQTTTGMVGAETIWVTHEHDRTYIGCSVPEESGQQQLGWAEDARETVITVVKPECSILAIRASDAGAAADARRAIVDEAGTEFGEELPATILETEFAARAIEKYRQVGFTSMAATSPIADLTISTDYTGEVNHDLLDDEVVESLESHSDIQLDRARVDLSPVAGETVTVFYTDSSIEFHRFVPESWLLAVDDAIAAAVQ